MTEELRTKEELRCEECERVVIIERGLMDPSRIICTDCEGKDEGFDDYDYDYDDELDCTWCGGEGIQENDDPFWHGFDRDWIPCECCNGTGLRKYQTIF